MGCVDNVLMWQSDSPIVSIVCTSSILVNKTISEIELEKIDVNQNIQIHWTLIGSKLVIMLLIWYFKSMGWKL